MPLSTRGPAPCASATRGATPIPTTAKSHSTVLPPLVRTRADGAVALERLDAVAEQQLDAVLHVHVAVEGADLGAEDPLVGQRERIDQRHVEAALARRRRELAADPAGADDGDASAGVEPLAQHVAVGERAQVVDAVEVGARDGNPPRLGAGRQQQLVVGELARRRRA